jgi:ABC-type dipeptide/oligopeptide/nickel transport system permease subunit
MATRIITIIGFAALILALFALEFLGRRKQSRIPTLGEWLGYVMRSFAGRLVILLGWLWLGWHYFAR